jgi:fimbrial chaperone protein
VTAAVFAFCMLVTLLHSQCLAANFAISPVRVFFDDQNKTNKITLKNESDDAITLQLQSFAWSQNVDGESIYTPTRDIIFFPKLLTIHPGESKIVRIGTKVVRGDAEQTYRMFIEEIPGPNRADTNSVQIVMKVGVPVFVAPVKPAAKAEIEQVEFRDGKLNMTVKNTGNAHFIIRGVKVNGTDPEGQKIYSAEQSGRYLHAGNARGFSFDLSEDSCHNIRNLTIDVDTDKISTEKQIDPGTILCSS